VSDTLDYNEKKKNIKTIGLDMTDIIALLKLFRTANKDIINVTRAC